MNNPIKPIRLAGKSLLLFIVINLLFIFLQPYAGKLVRFTPFLQKYERFPVMRFAIGKSEGAVQANRILITDMDILFNSHTISHQPKADDEYRVILLGDSSIWGATLSRNQTLAGLLNARDLRTCSGRRVIVYNLGYPGGYALRELLLLSQALKYQPDLVIWSFTLQHFLPGRQLGSMVIDNYNLSRDLIDTYNLKLGEGISLPKRKESILEKTIIGRRDDLQVILKLQLFNLMVYSLGNDDPRTLAIDNQDLVIKSTPPNQAFENVQPPFDLSNFLSLDSLRVIQEMVGNRPVILVNEPIYITTGENSDLRYDWLYPRWAFDQYRNILSGETTEQGWTYFDAWNLVPPDEFRDTVFHLRPAGEKLLAQNLVPLILDKACNK